MSSITFRDRHGEASVGGRERAHLAITLWHFTKGLLDVESTRPSASEPERERAWLAAIGRSDARAWSQPIRDFEMHLHVGGPIVICGEKISPFELHLNTALALGSDEMRLAARIHGQCEIHGYVEGHNRAWLADLIDSAAPHICRPETQGYGAGWRDVAALLRARSDEPVVSSYSVTESFPSAIHITNAPEGWHDLPEDQRWTMAVESLRAAEGAGGWLEWRPDNWTKVRFGDGLTALDLRARLESVGR